jgi:hypothetical protein
MRHFYLLLLLVFGPVLGLRAQCSYVSRQSGPWNDPNTWKPSGNGCPAVPGPEAVVTIGHDVVLTGDYLINGGGSLTVAAGSSLVQDQTARTLTLGDGTGSQVTRLTQAGRIAVAALAINKSDILISRGANLTLYCNLSQSNQSIISLDGDLNLVGTLNITTGNVSANGTGRMRIGGCVNSSNGGFNNYNSSLLICVQGIMSQNCGAGAGSCTGNPPINNDAACRAVLPILPVTLVYARATWLPKQTAVQLQWATATEEHNAGFTVERSADGRKFVALTTVPGAGNSLSLRTYAYTDTRPLNTAISYYRLRQTDQDGTEQFSPVMTVKAGRAALSLELLPTADGRYQPLLPGRTGAGQLVVYSAAGRLLQTYAIREGEELPLIDLRPQPAGMYLVRVFTPAGAVTQRVARL